MDVSSLCARALGKKPNRLGSVQMRIQYETTSSSGTSIRGEETAQFDFTKAGHIILSVRGRSSHPDVIRNAILTLDAELRPLDAYVRIQNGPEYEGCALFFFEQHRARSFTWNRSTGYQSVDPLEVGPVDAFCAHPVSTDALLVAAFDHSRDEGRQTIERAFLSSDDNYGRTGPKLTQKTLGIEHLGKEVVKSPWGDIATDHYLFYNPPLSQSPVEELWVLEGTAIFAKAKAYGEFMTEYTLVDLRYF